MSLKDELKQLTGKKRRFMLMRVAEVEPDVARKMCNVSQASYNSWLQRSSNPAFVELYRRVDEFTVEYKTEAIQMLRRDNQLSAVMLEEQIINKMKEEVASGDYNLIRTNLARDVYTRLIGDLDFQPTSVSQTWDERIQGIFLPPKETSMLEEGKDTVIDVPQVETVPETVTQE